MRELVEKRVAIRDVKRMMVWDADNSEPSMIRLVRVAATAAKISGDGIISQPAE